jgi:hypothetical protein
MTETMKHSSDGIAHWPVFECPKRPGSGYYSSGKIQVCGIHRTKGRRNRRFIYRPVAWRFSVHTETGDLGLVSDPLRRPIDPCADIFCPHR